MRKKSCYIQYISDVKIMDSCLIFSIIIIIKEKKKKLPSAIENTVKTLLQFKIKPITNISAIKLTSTDITPELLLLFLF